MDSKIKAEIPKYVFDKEYSTQWKREVRFLEEKGIMYTYGKKHYKYPIIRYKYTKTPELFLALAEFYNQVRNEEFFKASEKTAGIVKTPLEKGCIEINKEDLTEPEKKLLDIQEDDVINVIEEDTALNTKRTASDTEDDTERTASDTEDDTE